MKSVQKNIVAQRRKKCRAFNMQPSAADFRYRSENSQFTIEFVVSGISFEIIDERKKRIRCSPICQNSVTVYNLTTFRFRQIYVRRKKYFIPRTQNSEPSTSMIIRATTRCIASSCIDAISVKNSEPKTHCTTHTHFVHSPITIINVLCCNVSFC